MLYSLELQIMGIILLSAMVMGGISLWLKARKNKHELDMTNNDADN